MKHDIYIVVAIVLKQGVKINSYKIPMVRKS